MKETHTKSQLQEFRRKLVRAQTYSANEDFWPLYAALKTGGGFGVKKYGALGDQVSNWYRSGNTSVKMRAAMWQSSIADIDRRIKELK